jgi:hypothetical protein
VNNAREQRLGSDKGNAMYSHFAFQAGRLLASIFVISDMRNFLASSDAC